MKCEICLKEYERTATEYMHTIRIDDDINITCKQCNEKVKTAIRSIGDEARHDDHIRSAFDSALRGDDASALEHIDAAGESKNADIYGTCVCGKTNTANHKCEGVTK